MNKGFKLVFICLCAIFVSCRKDNTIMYNASLIGSYKAGVFTSDEGITYNVVEQQCDPPMTDAERVIVVCDILRASSGRIGGYEILVKSFVLPLVKDPVKKSEVTDDEALGKDPAYFHSGWFSGGYLNMNLYFTKKKDSDTKHLLNLVLDDSASTADTLFFSLRHNGYGEVLDLDKIKETYGSAAAEQSGIVTAQANACFPMKSLVPEGKESIMVKVFYSWYNVDALDRPTGQLDTLFRIGLLEK